MTKDSSPNISLDDEIEKLKRLYLKIWRKDNRYELGIELFEMATGIKDKYRNSWRSNEKSYLLDTFQSFGLIAFAGSPQLEYEEVMRILRNAPYKMHDSDSGAYRNEEELLIKIMKEILYICEGSLLINKNRVIQLSDKIDVVTEKVKANYEMNLYYSLLRITKSHALIGLIKGPTSFNSEELRTYFEEAMKEVIALRKGFIYADEKDQNRKDYLVYMGFFDTANDTLKLLKKLKDFRKDYKRIKKQYLD